MSVCYVPHGNGDTLFTRLERDARAAFRAGVLAADPGKAVRDALAYRDGALSVRRRDGSWRCDPWACVRPVAVGKAALGMLEAALDVMAEGGDTGVSGDVLGGMRGLAVTNLENARPIDGVEVVAAGHPLPDEHSVRGGEAILSVARQTGKQDLLLLLVSGGGSALAVAPAPGLTLDHKIETTRVLLACGADINEVNTVRKHLSCLKGGMLARAAAPGAVHALILSDVLGDDLSAVASGPAVPDPTTFAEAQAILRRHNAWPSIPADVRRHIEAGVAGTHADTPKPQDPVFDSVEATLIGSNSLSLEAMEKKLEDCGYALTRYTTALSGEARVQARRWAEHLATNFSDSTPFAMSAGGETTVTVTGGGKGGRNQEMALAFALAAEEIGLPTRWLFLSAGTDGRDGPTDAAGGIVTPQSLGLMREAGIDPRAALADNNAHAALASANALLVSGPTGTNVADLQLLLVAPPPF